MRYRVDHSKIKFISTRRHVISSIYLYGHGKIIPTYLLINERKTSHKAGSSAVSYIALERELTKRKREREEKKELLQHKIFVFGHSFKLETGPNRD